MNVLKKYMHAKGNEKIIKNTQDKQTFFSLKTYC